MTSYEEIDHTVGKKLDSILILLLVRKMKLKRGGKLVGETPCTKICMFRSEKLCRRDIKNKEKESLDFFCFQNENLNPFYEERKLSFLN